MEEKVKVEDVKIDLDDKADGGLDTSKEIASDDLFEKKRRWGKNINIYRLVNGKFQPKDYDEEQKKSQQIEEERRKKNEEEEKNSQNADVFKNNIKSRKAL